MPIPDFQSLFLPVLLESQTGEVQINDVVEAMIRKFQLTKEEAETLLPSGKQRTISNRTQWAKAYLSKAGLVESTRRGYFRITEKGRAALNEKPDKLDVAYLMRFPEFRQFREGNSTEEQSDGDDRNVSPSTGLEAVTPDELLRKTISRINSALAEELLSRILSASPAFFERVVVDLLLAMGYGGAREEAGRAIGKSGDGGLDGVIDQDALGLDRVYIQAKRYAIENSVSEPEVRGFSGALSAAKANKGVFVTTSSFTGPAREFVGKLPFTIVLIDGPNLASLMIRYNVGTRVEETHHLKKVDEDFFSED